MDHTTVRMDKETILRLKAKAAPRPLAAYLRDFSLDGQSIEKRLGVIEHDLKEHINMLIALREMIDLNMKAAARNWQSQQEFNKAVTSNIDGIMERQDYDCICQSLLMKWARDNHGLDTQALIEEAKSELPKFRKLGVKQNEK